MVHPRTGRSDRIGVWHAVAVHALPSELDTPCLVIDLDVVERNIHRLQAALDERGIALRPHFKTHKLLPIARKQIEAGAAGLTAGTLGEAEVLAYNTGVSNPVANAVGQWIGSDLHRGILSNGSYGRIGCAETVADGTHWFACVLAKGPLPAQRVSSASAALPDTRMPAATVVVRARLGPAID